MGNFVWTLKLWPKVLVLFNTKKLLGLMTKHAWTFLWSKTKALVFLLISVYCKNNSNSRCWRDLPRVPGNRLVNERFLICQHAATDAATSSEDCTKVEVWCIIGEKISLHIFFLLRNLVVHCQNFYMFIILERYSNI